MTIKSICILLILEIFSNNFLSLSCFHSNLLRAFSCPSDLFWVQDEPIPTGCDQGLCWLQTPPAQGAPLHFCPKAAVPALVTQRQIQLLEYNIQIILSLICHLTWEVVWFLKTSMSGKWKKSKYWGVLLFQKMPTVSSSVNSIIWTTKTEHSHLY